MRHPLKSLLALHWAAAFTLLSFTCVVGGEPGAKAALGLLGLEPGISVPAHLSLPLAMTFLFAGLLFFWMVVSAAIGVGERDLDDIALHAFTASAASVCSVLVIGMLNGSAGVLPTTAITLSALMISYLTCRSDIRPPATVAKAAEAEPPSIARTFAADAAFSAALFSSTGRDAPQPGGGR